MARGGFGCSKKRNSENLRAVWNMLFSRIHAGEQKGRQLAWTSVVSVTKQRGVKLQVTRHFTGRRRGTRLKHCSHQPPEHAPRTLGSQWEAHLRPLSGGLL